MIKIKKPKTATIKVSNENKKMLNSIRLRLQREYVVEMNRLGIECLVMDDAVTALLNHAVEKMYLDPSAFEPDSRLKRIENEYNRINNPQKEAS